MLILTANDYLIILSISILNNNSVAIYKNKINISCNEYNKVDKRDFFSTLKSYLYIFSISTSTYKRSWVDAG